MSSSPPQSDHVDAPAPTKRPRSARRGIKAWVIGGLAATVLIAGGIVGAVWSLKYTEAEQLVADYLAAVQREDAATAMKIAGSPPENADRGFLAPPTMNTNWTIESIAENDHGDVDIVIADEAGDTAEQTIGVQRDLDGVQVEHDAYAIVDMSDDPFGFVEVNGARESFGSGVVALFPGVYDFYGSIQDYFDLPIDSTRPVAGEMDSPVRQALKREPLALTDDGLQHTQQLVDDLTDECAARSDAVMAGCPFGALSFNDPDDSGVFLEDPRDVEWKVVEYPEVTVAAGYGELELSDRKRGTVEATGTAVRSDDGSEVEFAAECQISTHQLILDLGEEDSEPSIDVNAETKDGLDEEDPDPIEWDTC